MKNNEGLNRSQKKEFWSNHIRHFRKSGLSQKKYCEQENLSYWSFRTWYYQTIPATKETKFIKINTSPVREASASKIRLVILDRIRMEFDESISEETLRRIFKASEVLK